MSATGWEAVLTMPVTEDRDHIQGPADAAVTLVAYGDYECPYCGAAYPMIKQVQAAAAAQDRFWQMHDLLYENQRRLRDRDLRAYAEELGLDVELFDQELVDHVHAERVHEDFMSGVRSGVNGTPTFYINGARHDDSYEIETLLAALERAGASERGTGGYRRATS